MSDTKQSLRAEIETLKEENRVLTEDLLEYVVSSFCQIAYRSRETEWWCTQGLGTAKMLGERLVKAGTWERKPTDDLKSRVQRYRPV